MTLLQPPTWLENSALHNAQDYRTMLGTLTARTSVVGGSGDLAVTQSGTPGMSVQVAAGAAVIASTRSQAQGSYHAYNDAAATVTVPASHPTLPRIDRLIVQVRDTAQDGALGADDVRFLLVEGTPAASPVAPTITVQDYVELAQIAVGAGVTSIVNADITDRRQPISRLLQPTVVEDQLPTITDTTSSTTAKVILDRRNLWTAPCAGRLLVSFAGGAGFGGSAQDIELQVNADNSLSTTLSDERARGHALAAKYTGMATARGATYAAGAAMGYSIVAKSSVGDIGLFVLGRVQAVFYPSSRV